MRRIKTAATVIGILMAMLLISGCASPRHAFPCINLPGFGKTETEETEEQLPKRITEFKPLETSAPGINEERTEEGFIDWSNAGLGYVTAGYTAPCDKALRLQVIGPEITYVYCIRAGEEAVFPLVEGSGKYTVTVYRNVTGKKYAAVVSVSFETEIADELSPFLYPNYFVDYASSPKAVEKAAELTKGAKSELGMVKAVYYYIIENFTYDTELAKNIKTDYIPDPDRFLEKGRGVCIDYAGTMTAMLRSQGIPCKLVTGYTGEAFHAWINVYTEKDGWIDGAICFDGLSWSLMDPTFASSGDNSESIREFIGNGDNYVAKFFY